MSHIFRVKPGAFHVEDTWRYIETMTQVVAWTGSSLKGFMGATPGTLEWQSISKHLTYLHATGMVERVARNPVKSSTGLAGRDRYVYVPGFHSRYALPPWVHLLRIAPDDIFPATHRDLEQMAKRIEAKSPPEPKAESLARRKEEAESEACEERPVEGREGRTTDGWYMVSTGKDIFDAFAPAEFEWALAAYVVQWGNGDISGPYIMPVEVRKFDLPAAALPARRELGFKPLPYPEATFDPVANKYGVLRWDIALSQPTGKGTIVFYAVHRIPFGPPEAPKMHKESVVYKTQDGEWPGDILIGRKFTTWLGDQHLGKVRIATWDGSAFLFGEGSTQPHRDVAAWMLLPEFTR